MTFSMYYRQGQYKNLINQVGIRITLTCVLQITSGITSCQTSSEYQGSIEQLKAAQYTLDHDNTAGQNR